MLFFLLALHLDPPGRRQRTDHQVHNFTRLVGEVSMGGFLSKNSVVPQQPLSVVAASAVSQNTKARKNKRHKFNTLVPEPQAPSQPSQSTSQSISKTSAPSDNLTRADLRVQFLKAAKRGDVTEMADLLKRYQQPGLHSPDSHEDESEEGANEDLVNIRGMWESTPLISATQYAHCDAALWLLSHGANPHASNEKAVTALLLASLEGLTHVVVRLLQAIKTVTDALPIDKQVGVVYNSSADLNVRLSPLLAASMNGHADIVRLLVDHGAAVNQQVVIIASPAASTSSDTTGGSTALLLAARYGHNGVVTFLLERGADYNLIDGATETSALLSACEFGHEACALLLLEAMISQTKPRLPNDTETEKWQAHNRQGYTALHFAAANGLMKVCEALLATLKAQQQTLEDEVLATAFVNARAGARRESALLLAVRKRRHEVARILLEAGADAELADRGGNTATQVLARNKQDELLRLCEATIRSHKEEELREAESHAKLDTDTSTSDTGAADER